MKKIIAILAVAVAVSLNAQANNSVVAENEAAVSVAQAEEFVEIKIETLAAEVQTAIVAEVEKTGCKIKTVSQEKTSKDLKVVAVNAENVENVFMFDQAGKLKK